MCQYAQMNWSASCRMNNFEYFFDDMMGHWKKPQKNLIFQGRQLQFNFFFDFLSFYHDH